MLSLYHIAFTMAIIMQQLISGYQQNEMGSSGLFQGDRVKHPAFGPGIVSKLIADDKVEVLFRNAGRKLLHLEYTTLEKI